MINRPFYDSGWECIAKKTLVVKAIAKVVLVLNSKTTLRNPRFRVLIALNIKSFSLPCLIALFPGILEAVTWCHHWLQIGGSCGSMAPYGTYEKTAVPTVELGYCTAIAPIANHGSHEQSLS